MHPRLEALETADDVEALVRDAIGAGSDDRDVSLATSLASGVVQTVAVVRRETGQDHVLRIGEYAPKSDIDFFVLQFMRARVDVVVISGEVLRREPHLRYDLQELPAWTRVGAALADWRRRRGGRIGAPRLVVLSRSGDLPLDHGVWSSVDGAEIHTGAEGASRIGDAARARGIEVWHPPGERAGPRATVEHLRAAGHGGIAIEAGPGVSRALYEQPATIELVLRSEVRGPLDERACGPAWLHRDVLEARFRSCGSSPWDQLEPGWRFGCWVRT